MPLMSQEIVVKNSTAPAADPAQRQLWPRPGSRRQDPRLLPPPALLGPPLRPMTQPLFLATPWPPPRRPQCRGRALLTSRGLGTVPTHVCAPGPPWWQAGPGKALLCLATPGRGEGGSLPGERGPLVQDGRPHRASAHTFQVTSSSVSKTNTGSPSPELLLIRLKNQVKAGRPSPMC